MSLSPPGFSSTVDRLLWLLVVFTAVKVLSTGTLLVMGDYRAARVTPFRKFVAAASKISPVLMVLAALAGAIVRGDQYRTRIYTVLAVVAPVFAALVIWLRKTVRFYGLADVVARRFSS